MTPSDAAEIVLLGPYEDCEYCPNGGLLACWYCQDCGQKLRLDYDAARSALGLAPVDREAIVQPLVEKAFEVLGRKEATSQGY